MAKTMWDGRFSKSTADSVAFMNSSLRFDQRLYAHDIRGSIAHATMLARIGVLTDPEAQAIVAGLESIKADIESGALTFDSAAEDIHMFIEEELTARIGQPGKKLHTARSRNDQVATDMRLWVRDEISCVTFMIESLTMTVCNLATHHTTTVMPGYTHLQRAQPITFAHHLMAYAHMFMRDMSRLDDVAQRMNYSPLGAAALATTTYPIQRDMTADLLGFAGVMENSLDAVADRDYLLELSSTLSIFMIHLSRMSEEIILWASQEFRFIELDDGYATGSSIMPQKKNPDVAELTRGKTGRVIGQAATLLAMMKNLPLAYNKDLQEDKEAIFDVVDTVKLCIPAFAGMIATLGVNADRMRQAASAGFTNATDFADYLVTKGVPFRQAHAITGEIVRYCIEHATALENIDLATLRAHCDLIDADVYDALDIDQCVQRRNVIGGPAPEIVSADIDKIVHELQERQS